MKGLSPDAGARLIGAHCEQYGLKFAMGGDVSAWVWSEIHRIDLFIFVPDDACVAGTHRSGRPGTSVSVKTIMMAFHQNGDGHNSGGNA